MTEGIDFPLRYQLLIHFPRKLIPIRVKPTTLRPHQTAKRRRFGVPTKPNNNYLRNEMREKKSGRRHTYNFGYVRIIIELGPCHCRRWFLTVPPPPPPSRPPSSGRCAPWRRETILAGRSISARTPRASAFPVPRLKCY